VLGAVVIVLPAAALFLLPFFFLFPFLLLLEGAAGPVRYREALFLH
jgi:hypothetical protein